MPIFASLPMCHALCVVRGSWFLLSRVTKYDRLLLRFAVTYQLHFRARWIQVLRHLKGQNSAFSVGGNASDSVSDQKETAMNREKSVQAKILIRATKMHMCTALHRLTFQHIRLDCACSIQQLRLDPNMPCMTLVIGKLLNTSQYIHTCTPYTQLFTHTHGTNTWKFPAHKPVLTPYTQLFTQT